VLKVSVHYREDTALGVREAGGHGHGQPTDPIAGGTVHHPHGQTCGRIAHGPSRGVVVAVVDEQQLPGQLRFDHGVPSSGDKFVDVLGFVAGRHDHRHVGPSAGRHFVTLLTTIWLDPVPHAATGTELRSAFCTVPPFCREVRMMSLETT